MKDARRAPQMNLRIPANLKKWLEETAATNHRALNGEVLYALERYRAQTEKQAHAQTSA